ncbi:hypothetical protein B0H11DRAFT_2225406 [Mycena galericulata]|nr:hypothetical protein B0H11DRAFT_2225406 [Mycena galericulata]
MADHNLPDEIISEILSPALKVSEEVFSDTSDVSPFSTYSESTSAYLLVCKSWLRVATPLLYNVVILRSKAQAKALSQVLTKNHELGHLAPNISDLFVSLTIWASDNTVGLCKGLSLINPTRLIMRDFTTKKLDNKMLSNLVDALVAAIRKWDRLVIFECPYASTDNMKAVRALSYRTFKECPLRAIQIKYPLCDWELHSLRLDDQPALKALLKFTKRPRVTAPATAVGLYGDLHMTPPLKPFFVPVNASQEDKETAWSYLIFRHVRSGTRK